MQDQYQLWLLQDLHCPALGAHPGQAGMSAACSPPPWLARAGATCGSPGPPAVGWIWHVGAVGGPVQVLCVVQDPKRTLHVMPMHRMWCVGQLKTRDSTGSWWWLHRPRLAHGHLFETPDLE